MFNKLLYRLIIAIYVTHICLVLANIGDGCSASTGTGRCRLKHDCTKGYTVKGSCPNDPNDVLCCLQASCSYHSRNYSVKTGNCYDININPCTDGFYIQHQCPGGSNVRCCIQNPLISYLHLVYDVALNYARSHLHGNMGNSPNELVIGWLRHHGYDSLKWTALIGGIDQTWIQYVESQKVKWWDSFKDPKYDIPLELNHTGASIDGAFHKGMTHAGDMSGWGGDLITFYGDWQAQHSYPDGHDFAINVLASGSKKSHFGLTDMIEDADAFNIAKLLSEYPDNPIYQVFNYYYQAGGGYESRFATFYRDRFGGDVANAQAAAEEILTTTDPLIMAGRAYLIVTSAGKPVLLPSLLPKRELDSFTKGFAEALARLALNG